VQGETLQERIDREKQLSVEDAVTIAVAVASALPAAHAAGVVHRDIKRAISCSTAVRRWLLTSALHSPWGGRADAG
jgi:serine/threonine protein kinase